MIYTVLLDAGADTKLAEHEEKAKFIYSILEILNIDNPYPDQLSLDVKQRIHLKSILNKFDVKVIETPEGEIEVYFERERIAKWEKPQYILKHDLSELDPSKKLFLEMKVNFSSVFEDT